MVVWCQHHTGAGVGIAGDPGAVDGEHHEQHQHQHGDYGLDVGAEALLSFLLLQYMFTHLACLQGTAHNNRTPFVKVTETLENKSALKN